MNEVVFSREVRCRSDIAALWRVVADTNRLNRRAGFGAITKTPAEGPGAARFVVQTRIGVFTLEYEELPFEFVAEERFSVVRVMRRGPVDKLRIVVTFARLPEGGTLVEATFAMTPRARWLAPLVRLVARVSLAKYCHGIEELDRDLLPDPPALGPSSVTSPHSSIALASDALHAAIPPEHGDAARRLVEHVRSGSDQELDRLRPFELADAWKLDRRDVTSVCLTAVTTGLLEMAWELVCPSCRTGSDRVPTLEDLTDKAHCQQCDLSFGVEFDRAVEATFRPQRHVRKIDPGLYCLGGPATMPHVLSQVVLEPGAAAQLVAPEAPGRYRLFARGGATCALEVRAEAAHRARLVVGEALDPHQLEVAPGATIELVPDAAEARHVKLERVDWANRAATAHFVATLPSFRRLFSGELLRPGLVLKVTRAAFVFSDLTESTALYSRMGDAVAFRVIVDHLELLQQTAEKHDGTLIKTIGDSVMAVFLDEADAVRAAVEMLRVYGEFQAKNAVCGDCHLKIGVHAGACYAVTANKILDYFGQTVNVAARLQAKAGAGEIVLSDELAVRAESEGWLEGAEVTEHLALSLKGVDGDVRAARARLGASPSRAQARS